MKPDEGFDEDDLYEAMDALCGEWVGMEKALYARAFPRAVQLVLDDLTSVYFEGQGPFGISHYGHSRDHRSDRPQVVLAVATDAEGLSIHIEVLEIEHEGKRYVIAGGIWRRQRNQERRAARIAKGEAVLRKLAGARRRKPDAQTLASQAGRALERVKAHCRKRKTRYEFELTGSGNGT